MLTDSLSFRLLALAPRRGHLPQEREQQPRSRLDRLLCCTIKSNTSRSGISVPEFPMGPVCLGQAAMPSPSTWTSQDSESGRCVRRALYDSDGSSSIPRMVPCSPTSCQQLIPQHWNKHSPDTQNQARRQRPLTFGDLVYCGRRCVW